MNGWLALLILAGAWLAVAFRFAVLVGRVAKRRDVDVSDEFGLTAAAALTPDEFAIVNAQFAYLTSDLIDVRVAAQRILEEQR